MYQVTLVNYKLTGGGVLTNLEKVLAFFYRGIKIDQILLMI